MFHFLSKCICLCLVSVAVGVHLKALHIICISNFTGTSTGKNKCSFGVKILSSLEHGS